MIQPRQVESQPRIRNPRRAKNATQTRIVHNSRARYTGIVRVSAVLVVVLASLMGYVMLTSNMTSLTYAVAKAHHDREALQEQNARLDDRIAALKSDERLAQIANKLHLREPQQFALVRLPPPVASNGGGLLSSIAGWFGPPHAREH